MSEQKALQRSFVARDIISKVTYTDVDDGVRGLRGE